MIFKSPVHSGTTAEPLLAKLWQNNMNTPLVFLSILQTAYNNQIVNKKSEKWLAPSPTSTWSCLWIFPASRKGPINTSKRYGSQKGQLGSQIPVQRQWTYEVQYTRDILASYEEVHSQHIRMIKWLEEGNIEFWKGLNIFHQYLPDPIQILPHARQHYAPINSRFVYGTNDLSVDSSKTYLALPWDYTTPTSWTSSRAALKMWKTTNPNLSASPWTPAESLTKLQNWLSSLRTCTHIWLLLTPPTPWRNLASPSASWMMIATKSWMPSKQHKSTAYPWT